MRGQVITLYMTGAGNMTPRIPTGEAAGVGASLSDLSQPVQTTTMTIGGVPTPIDFIGAHPSLVGVTQVNFHIPDGVGTGSQPVIVTVGGVSSAPATLTVTQ